VTLAVATSTAATTTTQVPGCGLLVGFAGGPVGDPKYLLTLASGGTNTQYRLSGPGTAPADIGDLYAAKTPQLLAITGRLVTPNSAEPQAINVMDFTVTRVASCAASSTSQVFAATECTTASATAAQVIERYFALSTSNSAQAVTDCFAKVWRDKNDTNPTFAESAGLWSQSGPATNVVVTLLEVVNSCDRFRASAQMPPDSFWMKGQSGGRAFFSVGPEAGRMRIYEISTALTNESATTLRCP